MVRSAFISNGSVTDNQITNMEILLKRPRRADGNEATDAERDQLFQERHDDRSADPESSENGDSVLRFLEQMHFAIESPDASGLVLIEDVVHQSLLIAEDHAFGRIEEIASPAFFLVLQEILGRKHRIVGVFVSEIWKWHSELAEGARFELARA